MSTTARALGRRVAAGASALAIGLAGLGIATGAHAADGNIDTSKTGSIIIHKQESGSQQVTGTPDGNTETMGTPVADVVFTAFPINNLDLTTQAAWNDLQNWSIPANACGTDYNTPQLTLPGGGAAAFDAGKVTSPTNSQGETTLSDLPVKAYLLCETSAPSTVKTKAAPFLVTVPFPNNTANAASPDGNWLYDVNVYPKNTIVLAPTKGVDVTANGLSVADQVSFPVTATVPSIGENDSFSYFVLSDPLDANLESGTVSSVKVDGQAVDPSYYTVTPGQTVSVGFTKEGLAFLKTKPNVQVEVVFAAKVKSVPADGVIPNTADLYVDTQPGNNPPNTPPVTPPPSVPPTPTNKVIVTWGDLKVRKQDKDNQKALEGATFQVYNAADPYAADCSTATRSGDPLTVNGASEFSSDGSGLVNIAGLFVDKKAGAEGEANVVADHAQRCYVVVETKAPAGYTLPADPKNVTGVAVKAGLTTDAQDIVIDNTKQNVPQLPLTGASTRLILMGLGLFLGLLALGAGFRTRKAR